jgi:hypothetical protein
MMIFSFLHHCRQISSHIYDIHRYRYRYHTHTHTKRTHTNKNTKTAKIDTLQTYTLMCVVRALALSLSIWPPKYLGALSKTIACHSTGLSAASSIGDERHTHTHTHTHTPSAPALFLSRSEQLFTHPYLYLMHRSSGYLCCIPAPRYWSRLRHLWLQRYSISSLECSDWNSVSIPLWIRWANLHQVHCFRQQQRLVVRDSRLGKSWIVWRLLLWWTATSALGPLHGMLLDSTKNIRAVAEGLLTVLT